MRKPRQQERPLTRHEQMLVDQIDEVRHAYFPQDPDGGADGRLCRDARRVHPAVLRARNRLRTASYRKRLKDKRAPTLSQIGMSLCVAVATTDRLRQLSESERDGILQ